MPDPLTTLLAAARGPLGPPITVDFGTKVGPLGELATLLARCNGFYLYNAAVQFFHAGRNGLGPDVATWNDEDAWKEFHGRRAGDLFCFAQDLFGTQFAVTNNDEIVAFDPEITTRTRIGTSLTDWASWLLNEPGERTAGPIATTWQDRHGPLDHHQRLMPHRWFALGGGYDVDNLRAIDAITAMRARGPIAQQLHRAPDGAMISFHIRGKP